MLKYRADEFLVCLTIWTEIFTEAQSQAQITLSQCLIKHQVMNNVGSTNTVKLG
jgi:hypothetical protein